MEIKFLEPGDQKHQRELVQYCFRLDDEEMDFIEENIFEPEYCLAAYIKGELAASLTILPYEIFFQGQTVSMGGISAVGVWPEYRNQSLASSLLGRALAVMRDRGQLFSLLDPFNHQFYRKYGWGLALQKKRYELDIGRLQKLGKPHGRLKPLTADNLEDIRGVYEDFAHRFNGPARRSEKQWITLFKRQDKDGKYRYGYFDEEGRLRGYLFYKIEKKEFIIEELVADSLEIHKELLRFVGTHRAQRDQVNWQAPVSDRTRLLLEEPGAYEIIPFMMNRVVEVQPVLDRYFRCHSLDPGQDFTIKVDDSLAPWNDRVFRVSGKGGKPAVEPIKESEPDLITDISVFSQLVFGFIGLKEARSLGKVAGEGPVLDRLQSLFPKQPTYLNDHF